MSNCITHSLIALTLAACGAVQGQPERGSEAASAEAALARQHHDRAVASLGEGFRSGRVAVDDTELHYVRGGTGRALLLLHGFPQDWYEYHKVLPRLAARFDVVAVDLPGIGRSAPTQNGYDAAHLASTVHGLVQQLELSEVYLVGHDLGGIVGYAFARQHPEILRGVMLAEAPIPGVSPWREIVGSAWHIGFHQTPKLPEELLAGRLGLYFRDYFFAFVVDPNAFSEADMAHYTRAYRAPEQLRAGLEIYRAFPADEAFVDAQRDRIELPLVLAAADQSFGPIIPELSNNLSGYGWTNIRTEIVPNSRHYVMDEQPDYMATLIERYASE